MALNYIPENETKRKKYAYPLWIIVFVIIALVSTLVLTTFFSQRTDRNERYTATMGSVTEVLQYIRTQSLRVEYTAGGELHSFIDATSGQHKQNDLIEVVYNPENPSEARLHDTLPQYVIGVFAALGLSIIAAITLTILLFNKRSVRKHSQLAKLEAEARDNS